MLPFKKKVHFIGIGGIGVSALARWFLAHGYNVSGSDSSFSEITCSLKSSGATVFIGQKPFNIGTDVEQVVYSAAIQSNNIELIEAKKRNIATNSYSEVLGELTRKYRTIAVAGAHGKSTTTSLLSLVLKNAEWDPTVIIGTKLKEFGNSNFRNGKSNYLILEADEYTKAFLNYSPFAAIITNIDKEHLDFYKNLPEIKKVFLKFISNIKRGGILILNAEDKNIQSIKLKIEKIGKKNHLKIYWYSLGKKNGNFIGKINLKIFGDHNKSNALAVYTLAKILKIPENKIFPAINSFEGAWRRTEFRGQLNLNKANGINRFVQIYDDYAHHPTEIKTTLAGFRQHFPTSQLICVFQPHQVKRLVELFDDFKKSFGAADILVLLDVFKVKGRDNDHPLGSSRKLAEAIIKYNGQKVVYLNNPKKLKTTLTGLVRNHKSSVIVMMGAGSIYQMTDSLIR